MKSAKFLFFVTFCLFPFIVCSLSLALERDTTFVPLKYWKEYTNKEKEILRNRWGDEEVEAVVVALKKYEAMPDCVLKLGRVVIRRRTVLIYDLRGIPLKSRYLPKVDLSWDNLQGADLDSTNLQGAKLWNANLQGAVLWSARLDSANLTRINLQEVHLDSANLRRARLWYAMLNSANLTKTNLQEADLWRAQLQGSRLTDARLDSANLTEANLHGAYLWRANLQGANLGYANLQGTYLQEALLQDANLFKATFDSTYLWLVNLGEAKNIRYIVWGDTIENRYVIGEEKQADSTKSIEDFRKAEITYRDLKAFYKKELMDDVAGEFHYRENVVITKRYLRTKREPLNYLWGVFRRIFLESTYGYSSRPIWLLRSSVFVILLFFLIFAFLTIPRRTKSGIYLVQPGSANQEERLTFRGGRLFRNCFYFSSLAFVTFGYGALQLRQLLQFLRLEPVELKPVRWARIFVGIEAALGIWIFALLVTVLFGRG